MDYVVIPREVSIKDIIQKNATLSPLKYTTIQIKNGNTVPVSDFLERGLRTTDKGIEVGSQNYISRSPFTFIRTKCLQADSFLPCFSDDGVVAISPSSFKNYQLREGDILISKDSNIGESVILDGDYPNHMISGGIYRLPLGKRKFYLLGFLKSDFFRTQLHFLASKGATIRHAKTLFLDCKIPLPAQLNAEMVIDYFESIVQAILICEKEIRYKSETIHQLIDRELTENQGTSGFTYNHPDIQEVKKIGRLDTGLYNKDFKNKNHLVSNYKHGHLDLISRGFKWARGTSLEIAGLGTRLDSDTYKNGYYELIIPTNITEYGTVCKTTFIGTSKNLKTIKKGDIIFGGEGFKKGRSFVVCDDTHNIATNYHGIRIFKDDVNLDEAIFVRCFLAYWRSLGMIDYIGVGGSGGHCAPQYFGLIETPLFPAEKQKEIVCLYHNALSRDDLASCSLDQFIDALKNWTENAGIVQLDQVLKALKKRLRDVIHEIVMDEDVRIDFAFLN